MKYDDASWHYGGDFPAELPPEAGATHIGMFVAWALRNGLAGAIHSEDFSESLAGLENRAETPGRWFIQNCDEKFTDEDLSDQGNAFARFYYQGNDNAEPLYLADYATAFPANPDLYSVEDSWGNYDRISRLIEKRYLEWQGKRPSIWSRLFGR